MHPIEESSDSEKECDGGDGGDRDGGKGGGGRDGDALNDSRPRLSIWVLKEVCINQFEGLLRSGKIEFILLGSSQGRHALLDLNRDSTDGCSVIAGLTVVNHISTLDIDHVITNKTIDNIR